MYNDSWVGMAWVYIKPVMLWKMDNKPSNPVHNNYILQSSLQNSVNAINSLMIVYYSLVSIENYYAGF